jgi:ABC-2 type transport system permease protein
VGESAVAMVQVVAIFFVGLLIGVPMTLSKLVLLIPFCLVVCLFGGAFGVIILSNLSSQRSANQIFPFVMFPQFFLAGVFSPIKDLPLYLWILSRIAPMTYAVDLLRSVYYIGAPEYSKVTLNNYIFNMSIIAGLTIIFISFGTYLFIKNERNR